MNAVAIIPQPSHADRKKHLREQLQALAVEDWNNALKAADHLEAALRELDCEGIPAGVRDLAGKLRAKIADDIMSMNAVWERVRS